MELQSLDPINRRKMCKAMFVFVVFFIIADWLFFFVYLITRTLRGDVYYYLVVHVLLSILLNILTCVIATRADKDKSGRFSEEQKNYICTFSFFGMASTMSLLHAYFSPLWCAPAIIMMYASCYRDARMQKILLVLCYIVTCFSAVFIIAERPEDLSFYMQNLIVVIVMDTVLFF